MPRARSRPGPAAAGAAKLLENLRRRPWLWAAAALAVGLVLNRDFRRLVSHGLELRRLGAQIEAARREGAELKERVALSGSDDAALERAARKELGYLKPGEIEYRFPPPR